VRTSLLLLGLLIAIPLGFLTLSEPAGADGNCASHYPYKVTDGHSRSHDRDGDGVGCEANPLWPSTSSRSSSSSSSSDSSSIRGYDRDNWSYDSSAARTALGCSSTEHVDHIVALKEAYDSGASSWTSARKRQFANDHSNMWCLDASLNLSKSDRDLAEWSGGSCEQRKEIARVTLIVKARYALNIDTAERRAINAAQARNCGVETPAPTSSGPASVESVAEAGAELSLEVRIVARRLPGGLIEFAIQYRLPDGTWSQRVLPENRRMSGSGSTGRWLVSSPVMIP